MAFHIDTYDLPPLRCYGDAHAYWSRIKPWRGDGDKNTRPIAGRKKRHMTIRMLNDESIAMRLWHTDVLVYHKNGDLTLDAYGSVSTDSFARCLTPWGVDVSWNTDLGYMLHLKRGELTHTVLQRDNRITLKRDPINGEWAPLDESMLRPFTKYAVNVKKANAVLKEHRFNDFVAWLKAVKAMGTKFLVDPWSRHQLRHPEIVELMKAGGEGWMKVAEDTAGDEDQVRQMLYVHFQCVEQVKMPYVVGFDTGSLRASHRRWGRLVNCYTGG